MKKAICVLQSNGIFYGNVIFSQCCKKHEMKILFSLQHFPANETHAIHIHEFGDTTDGCKSLGPHYNPHGTTHGTIFIKDMARHAGDLINNFTTDKDGKFTFEYTDDLPTLYGEDSILGRSIVIHKGEDDLGLGKGKMREESLKTGNAGERIVCGVIGLMGGGHIPHVLL